MKMSGKNEGIHCWDKRFHVAHAGIYVPVYSRGCGTKQESGNSRNGYRGRTEPASCGE